MSAIWSKLVAFVSGLASAFPLWYGTTLLVFVVVLICYSVYALILGARVRHFTDWLNEISFRIDHQSLMSPDEVRVRYLNCPQELDSVLRRLAEEQETWDRYYDKGTWWWISGGWRLVEQRRREGYYDGTSV